MIDEVKGFLIHKKNITLRALRERILEIKIPHQN